MEKNVDYLIKTMLEVWTDLVPECSDIASDEPLSNSGIESLKMMLYFVSVIETLTLVDVNFEEIFSKGFSINEMANNIHLVLSQSEPA
jgi:hypothetical protein